jgi:diadenosine tetraphosphate (Ap4A) HIT family hydrolase
MNSEESAELSCVMKWYEEKCRLLFGAEKFNYVAAMMRDNFVHFHAFPRYSKPVSRYGIEWKDDRWPRLLQFGPSVCEPKYYQLIKEDLKEN